MIQYALKCADGHEFDSWFQSASAFEKLVSAGMVTCVVCGNAQVEKAIMTPRLRTGRKAAALSGDIGTPGPGGAETAPGGPLRQPGGPAQQAMAALRRKVEENSDYVGRDFVSQARAMHDGDVPLRSIYGEARVDEAKKLIEDGVPVAPLPFMPARKTN